MITNKKGVLARDIVIAMLLFTGVIAIFVLSINSISNIYDNDNIMDDDFAEHYDKLSEISDDVNIARDSSQSGEGLTFIGTYDVIFSSTFTVIKMVFSSIGLLGEITGNFVADYTFLDAGIVKLFFIIALAILTTILVFVWISSITKGRL